MYYVKQGVHTLIMHQGCNTPAQMPLFLRQLDAQLDVRHLLAKIKLFEDGGDGFFSACAARCNIQFFDAGEVLATEGDEGDSMFFIVSGDVDIVDGSTGNTLAELHTGDFAGEMSLLLGIPRSKSLICAETQSTPSGCCTIGVLSKASLEFLGKEYAHVIGALRRTATKRKNQSQVGSLPYACCTTATAAYSECRACADIQQDIVNRSNHPSQPSQPTCLHQSIRGLPWYPCSHAPRGARRHARGWQRRPRAPQGQQDAMGR